MKFSKLMVMLMSIFLITSFTCKNKYAEGEHGEEGEELGTQYAIDDTCDEVRNGVRLILAYDTQSNSFSGAFENITDRTLEKVRVEVHLSNGLELGPTIAGDLTPGEKRNVTLTTTSTNFAWWTAHPEVGSGEHGHGEGAGEHDREVDEHESSHEGEHRHEQDEEQEHQEQS